MGLKEAGFEKEEIKTMIKENLKKDEEKRIVLLQERGEDVSDIEMVNEGVIEEVEQEISVDEPSVEPEQKVTEPKVTEPKVIEPKVTEPKVTEPKKVKEKKVD